MEKNENMNESEGQNEAVDIEFDEVVFLMDADTAKMVKVSTGIQDDEYIMVKSGIKLGDQVISGPYSEVRKKLKCGG